MHTYSTRHAFRLRLVRIAAAAALVMTTITTASISNYFAHTSVAYAATDYCTQYDYRYQTIDEATMWDDYGVAWGYVYLCAYTASRFQQNRVALWEPGVAQLGTITIYLGGGDGLVNYCKVSNRCATGVGNRPPDYARGTYQGYQAQTKQL